VTGAQPVPPPDGGFLPWETAWQRALYGRSGFYRQDDGAPARHFRTGVQASSLVAEALARLARACRLPRVVDVGAGQGELLTALAHVDPGLALVGVDVRDRPKSLAEQARWLVAGGGALLPDDLPLVGALVVAHEWLDDVPCPVVQSDEDGHWRQVEVEPSTGHERLGAVASREQLAWLTRWWPAGGPGCRAEVGSPRDQVWSRIVAAARDSVLVAVDYQHERADRPPAGSLVGYRAGRVVPALPDGTCDVTAHVALDAVAWAGAAAGARSTVLTSQREALRALGVTAGLPDASSARTDPVGYLRALQRAGEASELLDPHGLGSFGWLLQSRGPDLPFVRDDRDEARHGLDIAPAGSPG
jgi:SAM-dependent MidA family methyltransferase